MQVQVAALGALCQVSIQQGDVRGLLQLLDDSMELLVSTESSTESSADSAAARSVWLTVLAATALPVYRGVRDEILSRITTWKVLQSQRVF